MPTDDDDDRTIIERIRPSRGNAERYTGSDRRASDRLDWIKLMPLILTAASGIYGYAKLESLASENHADIVQAGNRIDRLEQRLFDEHNRDR